MNQHDITPTQIVPICFFLICIHILHFIRPEDWAGLRAQPCAYWANLRQGLSAQPVQFTLLVIICLDWLIGGKSNYDYKSVRRWTTQKKLGYSLIECDKIFVPIHKEIHWCLAVINKAEEKLQYLDSLKGRDTQVMNRLAKYYVDEVKDKCGKDINLSSWKLEYVEDLPEQENGFDCGVFMIKYADFYSRGLDLCFKQEHMPYFRLRTAKEILKLRAD